MQAICKRRSSRCRTPYAQLEAEGYLYTREKRGYYVADVERHPAAPGRAPARSAPQPQRSWLLDLSSGGSGTEDFPFSVWAKLMRRVLSEEGEALLRATPPNGADALRRAIAQHLYRFRGISAAPGADRRRRGNGVPL